MLNNGNDDENEEKGEGELDSDENDEEEDDDDDEPTLMSRSKHCAKQVYLLVSSFVIFPYATT